MNCCGDGFTRRQWMRATLLSSAGAALAGCAGTRGNAQPAASATASQAPAEKVLADHISVDVHSHAGVTGVVSKNPPSDDLARGMRAGRIAIVCLADVPDAPILGRNANNVLGALRQPAPGELYRYHLDRLAWMADLGAQHGVRRVLTVSDLRAAHTAGQPAIILDVEGLAETVKHAVKVSTKPLLLSHTALRGSKAQGATPLTGRQITPDHARAIAETGGSIGLWHFFATFERYVDGLKEMADVVGVDHVSIGTDQQPNPGLIQDYAVFTRLVEAMLKGGFTPDDAGKIVGGNYVRIFAASCG